MMPSHWAMYQAELRGTKMLEWEFGFVLYDILPNLVLHVEDVFVVPSERNKGRLHAMWDAVVLAGRKSECTVMMTNVDLVAKTAAASLALQLHMGLIPFKAESNRIWLKRSIAPEESHG